MKIALSGKGGVGKTTIAGTMARILARDHHQVLALDVDSNPNLARSLGVTDLPPRDRKLPPHGLTEWRTDSAGRAYVYLKQPVSELIAAYGQPAPDGVTLMVMGEVETASTGCRCEAHAMARGLSACLADEADIAVLDMEAGLEHLGRGTAEHVDALLIVVEPYFRALEAASRIGGLAGQMQLPQILVVGNRVRSEQDETAIREYCDRHGLEVAAIVPYDDALVAAEKLGVAPLDFAPEAPAIRAIARFAHDLELSYRL